MNNLTMNGQQNNILSSKNAEICRICMRKPESDQNDVYANIFESTIKGFQLKDLILNCLSVEVNKEDNKSNIICKKCFTVVRKWIKTKQKAYKSQHIIDCTTTNVSPGENLIQSNKIKIYELNQKYVSNVQTSPNSKNSTIVNSHKDGLRTPKRKYTEKITQNARISTEEHVSLPIDQDVFQNSLIEQNAQEKLLAMVPCGNNELKQFTGDKMETDDENKCDIDMSLVSVEKSKPFNSSDRDVVIHNTHGIRWNNEEKYSNQLTKHSQNSIEGRLKIDLNTFQTKIYQRPLITRLKPSPLVAPINNNELSKNGCNTVNIEIVNKKIKYDEIMNCDLDVQTSAFLNNAYSAVSNSKKRMYVKTKMDNNLQITPEVEKKKNTSPLRLLNQLVCGMDSKMMIASDNEKSDDITNQGKNVSSYSDVLKVIASNSDGTRTKERKCVKKISNLGTPNYYIFDGIIDASEPRYCICDQVSFGKMVACDNKACITEWYHYDCVGIIKPPRGKWYCPKCLNTVTKLKCRKKAK